MACNGVFLDDYNRVIPKSSYKLKEIQPDDYESLTILYLDNSNIQTITDDCFQGLEHLEHLGLSFNKIKHLKSNQFNGLVSLKYLRLTNCEIETIESDCFSQLDQLQELGLQGNKIKHIKSNQFNCLVALKDLLLTFPLP